MSVIKIRPKLINGVIVALFLAVALYFRVYLAYGIVFSGDWIKFTSNDAYYHMYLVDNLVHNFPQHMGFAPYFIFPEAGGTTTYSFFQWLIASITWVVGLGSPTQHTVDVVGVYIPAVLGALTVIPVYFIGKELFGRWAGVISAGLVALLPGEFMGRSILGFTDQHVAEVLFTTVTLLFLLLAIKTARQRQLTFSHFKRRDWLKNTRPVIYSLLAGVFLGIYLLTWLGGSLFTFIIALYFIIQSVIDHLKQRNTDYLSLIGVPLLFIAMIMFLPAFHSGFYVVSLVVALFIPAVLNLTSWLMVRKGIRPAYYPLTLLGIGVVGLGLFYLVNWPLLSAMLDAFGIFMTTAVERTTIEMQPFLFPRGSFSLSVAWGNFTTSFFLSFISLGILIYLVIKRGNSERSLLVVWSLVILAATLGQRRFAYYYAVNVALLTGYLSVLAYYVIRFIIDSLRAADTDYMSWQTLELEGSGAEVAEPVAVQHERDYYKVLGIARGTSRKTIKRAFHTLVSQYPAESERSEDDEAKIKEINSAYQVLSDPHRRTAYDRSMPSIEVKKQVGSKTSHRDSFAITARQVTLSLGAIVIFFLVFFPNIGPAITTPGSQVRFAPSDAWMSSLDWLQKNTPDPFGNPDFYYALQESPPPGESFNYPESAYGVLAWWDYGYWITRIAHRLPNANPSQDPAVVTAIASFFTSQDEEVADEIARELESSYIVIDNETATSKFWAIVTWTGKELSEFSGSYLLPQGDQLVPVQLLHPEYYYSLSSRLYNFDGQAVTPKKSVVISYQEQKDKDGNVYKVITAAEEFSSYQEAEGYLSSQKSGNHKIVGTNPFVSPVPLAALEHYRLVYRSDEGTEYPEVGFVPGVKIFEYIE